MNSNILCSLSLTEQQYDTVKAVFSQHGWGWDVAEQSVQRSDIVNTTSSDGDSPHREPLIQRNENQAECLSCLCQPCVMDDINRQSWWPTSNCIAKSGNRTIRKRLYKKFWTMLCHRGVWNEERYVQRKERALSRDRRYRHFEWLTNACKRDLMPNCVILCVRDWYPNPEGQSYMGHLWE